MATAPSEISTITDDSAAQTSIWRRIAERPYAPETLLLYSVLSFFFLGRNLIGHFSDHYIGMGQDPQLFLFFFEWWRYALANHLNPFLLTAAWYPPGFNLALTTSVPLAALTMMPVEATLGPIAAYNIAMLLCPALAAWSAFLLCRYITRCYSPSFVGGYIFGFSSYMLAHSLGNLTLTMVFLLPTAVYLVLLWFAGGLSATKFTAIFSLVLFGQFLSSLEVLATMALAGSAFLLLLWLWADKNLGDRILKLVPLLALSILLVGVLASPYLYYFFRDGAFPMPKGMPRAGSSQLIDLFVPVSTNIIGSWKVFMALAMAPNIWEAGEYVGIPLLLVLWSFASHGKSDAIRRSLAVFFVIACIGTLGAELKIGAKQLCPLPWQLVTYLPVLHVILPDRLSIYLFLDLAVITAMWLTDSRNSAVRWRIVAAVAVIASLLPNLSGSYWTTPANVPAFFSQGIFREYLSPDETAIVLPYGYYGDSDAWLAEARMYFRMAEGYVGIIPAIPADFQQYPAAAELYDLVNIPDMDMQLKCFLAQKHVRAIIVADEGEHLWRRLPSDPLRLQRIGFSPQERQVIRKLFAGLGVAPIHVGGVSLYRVPRGSLQMYATVQPDLLQRRVAAARLATLIIAANQYLAHGYDSKSLTPLKAQQLGLLPPYWVGGVYEEPEFRQHSIQDELLLGGDVDHKVGVGVLGPKSVLEELVRDYSPFAARRTKATADALRVGNAWLFPPGVRTPNPSDVMQWVVLLEFRPDGLAQAAKVADRALAEQAAHPLIDESTGENSVPKAAVSTISSADGLR